MATTRTPWRKHVHLVLGIVLLLFVCFPLIAQQPDAPDVEGDDAGEAMDAKWLTKEVVVPFGGIVLAALLSGIGFLIWWKFFRKSNESTPSGNSTTGPQSPIQSAEGGEKNRQVQLTGDSASVDQSQVKIEITKNGIDPDRHAEVLAENKLFRRELEELKELLAAGEQRAENDSGEDAKEALAQLREEGDSGALLAYLFDQAKEKREQINEELEEYLEIWREAMALAYVRGEIDKVREAIRAIQQVRPDDLDAINYEGHVARLVGDLAAAETAYLRYIEILPDDDPDVAVGYGNLGIVYKTRGDLDGAEEWYPQGPGD